MGEIAIDGTKMRASASHDRNRGYASIGEEIFEQAEQIHRAGDEQFGDAHGDELPEQLRTRDARRQALAAARERLQAQREARRHAGEEVVARVELELDPQRFVTRPEGRRAWLREGRRWRPNVTASQCRSRAIVGSGSPRPSGGLTKSLPNARREPLL